MHAGIEWLNGLSTKGIRPGLGSISALAKALGNPQEGLRTIHVAGSDGKGSVCCMLESILISAGYRVGMFNTPYILSVNESIRIDGRNIDDGLLDSYLLRVMKGSEEHAIDCTNFEALTACAFLCFREEKVDIAIIEVGMGGREDATNIIVPDVSVINNISLEHTAFLGDTVEEIAWQKAGIMKPGVPCVTINAGAALETLRRCSAEIGCPLISVDPDDISITASRPEYIMMRYGCDCFEIGIPGRHQARNAALAVEAIRCLKDSSRISPFIRIGLESAHWPFRMEKLPDRSIVLDVTHTRKGAECLAEDISEIYGKVVLVTAMLSDKDLDGVAETLSKIAKKVLISSPYSPRAADKEELASCYRRYCDDVEVFDTVGEAVEQALKNDDIILVTGSFRTAEDCLRWLRTAE